MAAPTTPAPAAPRARRRALLLLGLLVGLFTWGGVVGGPAPAASAAPAAVACPAREARAGASTVAVVVEFPGGRVRTRCVEAGGSGIDLLRQAGFAPVTYGYASEGGDAAVCALRDPDTGTVEGCQSGPSCLTCLKPDSWVYFPGYRYSSSGAGGTRPRAGSVEAWRWQSSMEYGGTRATHAQVCGASEPTPTTAPPTTTRPPSATTPADPGPGGGGGSPGGGGTPGGGTPGGGGPGGAGDPTTPGDPADPGGSTPDGSSTTAADGSTTTEAGAGEDGSTTTEAAEVDGAEAERAGRGGSASGGSGVTDEEERALGERTTSSEGSDGGGPPVVPLVVTALVVAGVAALAIRARRARGSGPGPDTAAT